MQFPYLSDESIEGCACRLLSEYEQECGPAALPVCPDNIVWDYLDGKERLTLDVEADLGTDGRGHRIAGATVPAPVGGLIRIDAEFRGTPMYSFTVGHELGHWTLHRSIALAEALQGSLFEDEPARFVCLQRDVNGGAGSKLRREEWQANRFAVHLLMPAPAVRDEFAKRFGSGPLDYSAAYPGNASERTTSAALHDYARTVVGSRASGNPPLWQVFGVSKEAMAIRLQELHLVVEETTISLM